MNQKKIIMVSSSVYGIEELLEQIFAILNKDFTVWMSHKGTLPVDPQKSNFENCLAAVEACDMFLGIMTTRYGSGKNKDTQEHSITHQEISKALKLPKPRWFLAHQNLVFARGLISDLGHKTPAERAKLKLHGKNLVDDLRVLDMYDEVIQAEKKLKDRRGNWAQPFQTFDDAQLFVLSQFLRFSEAAEDVKQIALAAKALPVKAAKTKGNP